MGIVIDEFDVKTDDRKRLAIPAATAKHYHVTVYDDGHLELHPRMLVDATISRRTLAMIDESIANMQAGVVSAPLDIAALEALADRDD